jgi:hypothetical protein
MSNEIFFDLYGLLVERYILQPSLHIYESIDMFLFICASNESSHKVQNHFKHLSEIITRKFDETLKSLMAIAKEFLDLRTLIFIWFTRRIRDDRR